MLKHASRSRHIDLDRPPAAAGGLRSQVPDLVHGPRELLDCRQLQQAGRRERTRSFDRRSKAGIDLAASAITLGRQSLVRRCPADDQRRSGLESFSVQKTGCPRADFTHEQSGVNPGHAEGFKIKRFAGFWSFV